MALVQNLPRNISRFNKKKIRSGGRKHRRALQAGGDRPKLLQRAQQQSKKATGCCDLDSELRFMLNRARHRGEKNVTSKSFSQLVAAAK